METQNDFNQDILAASAGSIVKKQSPQAAIIGLLLAIVGLALIIVAPEVSKPGSSMAALFYTVGALAIIAGGVVLLCFGKSLKLASTGSRVKQDCIYFDTSDLQTLVYLIETTDFAKLNKIKRGENKGVRMDINVSQDGKFASMQLFHYIPHNYEAASPIYCFYEGNAENFFDAFAGFRQ